jgi:hypothetical protein
VILAIAVGVLVIAAVAWFFGEMIATAIFGIGLFILVASGLGWFLERMWQILVAGLLATIALMLVVVYLEP